MKIRSALICCLAALTLTGCYSSYTLDVPNSGEMSDVDIIPEEELVIDISPDDSLRNELEKYIADGDHYRALCLYEENLTRCSSDNSFSDITDELLNHYSKTARSYYDAASAYLTEQEISGYDISTGFDGYDPANGTVDPHAFGHLLDDDEKSIIDRTVVSCEDRGRIVSIKVTIDVCGTTVAYPAEDVQLSDGLPVPTNIPDDTSTVLSAEALVKELENCISRSEYGKAVRLYEENIDICGSDGSFSDITDDIVNHFCGIAKLYYQAAVSHLTIQETKGFTVEGYDPVSGTIDPHSLEYLLHEEEMTVIERTVIKCDANGYPAQVTIDICGRTAVYPAEDIRLPQEADTAPAASSVLSAEELKKELENHISREEYGKAVQLYEENIDICGSDKSFSNITSDLLEHFKGTAKLYYTNAATYITLQQVKGYDASTGFDGYNSKDRTLDPHVLDELTGEDGKAVMERTTIMCDEEGWVERVYIDICGTTVVFSHDKN